MRFRNTAIIVVALLALASSASAQSAQLRSYEEVMEALAAGIPVRVVVHYARCTYANDTTAVPDAIGGMPLDVYEHFARGVVRNAKAYLASSHTVLISHPHHGIVFNYARIKLFEDGALEINAKYVDPKSFELKMDATYLGTLNNGSNGGAADFLPGR